MTLARSLRGRSVLVTGGAGFIGSHVVDRLIGEGPSYLGAIDNLWLGRAANLSAARALRPDVELHVMDVTDAEALHTILRSRKVEVIFHLATIPLPASLERPAWSVETIVRMSNVLAEAARESEYSTLVQCSSSEVYGSAVAVPMGEDHPLNPMTPYAAAKAAADLVVLSYQRTFGIDAAIVRPFNTYGPRQNTAAYAGIVPLTLRRVLNGQPPLLHGDGAQTRDLTYVTDVAAAIVRTYEVPKTRGLVINVGSGKEVAVRVLLDKLLRLTGSSMLPVAMQSRPADVRRHLADVSRARELLDYSPSVDLDDGLRRTVEWYAVQPALA